MRRPRRPHINAVRYVFGARATTEVGAAGLTSAATCFTAVAISDRKRTHGTSLRLHPPPPAGRPLDILSPLVTSSVCVWAYGGVLSGSTHGLLFASMTCIREGGPLRRDHRCPPALGHPLGRLLGHRDHPAAYVGLTGTSRKKLGWCAPGARWIGAALHEPLTSDPERPVGQSNRMRRRC